MLRLSKVRWNMVVCAHLCICAFMHVFYGICVYVCVMDRTNEKMAVVDFLRMLKICGRASHQDICERRTDPKQHDRGW